jgi:dolichyl-phosphate-mannose-protein mannosyltransferase
MKNKIIILVVFSLFAVSGSLVFAQENLLKNPGFEETVNGKPSFWEESGWKKDPEMTTYGLDSVNTHSGKSSAMITNKQENHAYYTQMVTAEPNSKYKLSAWIRTNNVGKQAIGGATGVKDKLEVGGDLRETSPWKEGVLYIETGTGISSFTVLLSVGWYAALNTGTAWFDDASLVKVDSIPAGVTVCKIMPELTNNEQPQKQETGSAEQGTKTVGAIVFFLILGGIIVIAGVLFLILVVLKKKGKDETKEEPKPETGSEGDKPQE